MKKTVKILSLLLAIAVLFGSFQSAVFAQGYSAKINEILEKDEKSEYSLKDILGIYDELAVTAAETSGEWEYIKSVYGDYAFITKWATPKNGVIEIPETLDGYEVVGWDVDVNDYLVNELSQTEYELSLPDNFPQAMITAVMGLDDLTEAEKYDAIHIGFVDMISLVAPTSFKVSNRNEHLACIDGILYSKDKTLLIRYPIGRDADSYYLPKKAKTYFISEKTNKAYEFGPFLPITDYADGSLQIKCMVNINVHVHEEQMQVYYDWYTGRNPEDYVGFAMCILDMFIGVKEICTEWNSEMSEHFARAKAILAIFTPSDLVDALYSEFTPCNGLSLSYLVWWEWILYIFFFGWIWY